MILAELPVILENCNARDRYPGGGGGGGGGGQGGQGGQGVRTFPPLFFVYFQYKLLSGCFSKKNFLYLPLNAQPPIIKLLPIMFVHDCMGFQYPPPPPPVFLILASIVARQLQKGGEGAIAPQKHRHQIFDLFPNAHNLDGGCNDHWCCFSQFLHGS